MGDLNILQAISGIAGLAGLSITVVFLIFRRTIAKNIFPTLDRRRAFHLLALIMVLTTVVGLAGLAAYVILRLNEHQGAIEMSRDRVSQAKKQLATGRFDEVVVLLKKAHELDPTWSEPVGLLAQTYRARASKSGGNLCHSSVDYDAAMEAYELVRDRYDPVNQEAREFINQYLAVKEWEVGHNALTLRYLTQLAAISTPPGGVVVGRVQTDDGSPLPFNFHLGIRLLPRYAFWECFWDPRGNFMITVAPGSYVLEAHLADYQASPRAVPVSENDLVNLKPFVLHHASQTTTPVRLSVSGTDGAPLPGVRVLVDQPGQPGVFTAVTGDDGSATFQVPETSGIWHLSTLAPPRVSVWRVFSTTGPTPLMLGSYRIGLPKSLSATWEMDPNEDGRLFAQSNLVRGTLELTGFDPSKRGFDFAAQTYRDGNCNKLVPVDIEVRQAGDSMEMPEVAGAFSTERVILVPGRFACMPLGKGGLMDLGLMKDISEAPRPPERRDPRWGLDAIPDHTYVLRTFDGSHTVLIHVRAVADVASGDGARL